VSDPAVYLWPQSAEPGDTVGVHASGPAGPATLEIARIGATREVVRTASLTLEAHELPDDAVAHGCAWPRALDLQIPDTWRSGYYEVSVRSDGGDPEADGREALAFLVVRAPAGTSSKPLLVLSTNTWNAYNDVGGANLYSTFGRPVAATHVSFQRPLAPGFLRRPELPGQRATIIDPPDPTMTAHVEYMFEHLLSEWVGSAGWAGWELHFVRWAEAAGYELDYAANADLGTVPGLLDDRSLYLSVGHDEYWTWEMRDAVEDFVARGGNAVFLSGNTSCWQVRLEDDGATMVAYKEQLADDPVLGTDDRHLLTSLWSDHLIGRAENEMTGVSFSRGGYHRIGRNVGSGAGGYTVHRPGHWVFEGTEVGYGDLIGSAGVAVGYECDGCELEYRDGLPFPTGADGTPKDFEVLGTAPARPIDRDTAMRPLPEDGPSEGEFIAWRVLGDWSPETVARLRHGHAVMGVHQPGGTVFTSGCTEWVWGLVADDPVIDRVTRNLLDRLGRRAGAEGT